MKTVHFDAQYGVDQPRDCGYCYISGTFNERPIHFHDYYEMFITLSDGVMHHINGENIKLDNNTLVFIRPGDKHTHTFEFDNELKFLNITFRESVMKSLFSYLSGAGFKSEELLLTKMPPTLILSKAEKEEFLIEFERHILFTWKDEFATRLSLRLFLTFVFTKYFARIEDKQSEAPCLPYWLEVTCGKMKQFDNFSVGMERMIEISGKSQEYLARCMKIYFGMTTTEFINDLRLNYVANMLIASDMHILNLIFDCGFQSVAHFYKLFKVKYGMSPTEFKKRHITSIQY